MNYYTVDERTNQVVARHQTLREAILWAEEQNRLWKAQGVKAHTYAIYYNPMGMFCQLIAA